MNTNPFIGVWSLESLVERSMTDQQVSPWGEDPVGQLIYSSTGHMSVTYMRRGRRQFTSPDITAGTNEEIREAFLTFDAYAGTYDVNLEAGTVTHHVKVSRHPNQNGISLLRHFKLSGDTLKLVTPPMLLRGQEWILTLTWRRVE